MRVDLSMRDGASMQVLGGKTDDAASLRNRLKVDDDREPTKDTRNLLLFLGSLSV